MRGHHALWALRRQGFKPTLVFINDYECEAAHDWHNPGARYGEQWPCEHVTLSTAGDVVSELDWRVLVGLRVTIVALSRARAQALFEHARQAGAALVLANAIPPGDPNGPDAWSEVWVAPNATEAQHG